MKASPRSERRINRYCWLASHNKVPTMAALQMQQWQPCWQPTWRLDRLYVASGAFPALCCRIVGIMAAGRLGWAHIEQKQFPSCGWLLFTCQLKGPHVQRAAGSTATDMVCL